MRKFKLENDYYGDEIKLYKKRTITLEPGLTVLVGCNGSGKTTLLKQIKTSLNKEKIECVSFDNLHDGGTNARSSAAFYGDLNLLAESMCSSEGENIAINLGEFAKKIGSYFKLFNEQSEMWILLDAVDSGLSIDAIEDLKIGLFNTIFEHYKNKEIYIIVSANEYEMARNEKCFDVIRGRYVSIKSYDKYRSVIMKSREEKDKRYEV